MRRGRVSQSLPNRVHRGFDREQVLKGVKDVRPVKLVRNQGFNPDHGLAFHG